MRSKAIQDKIAEQNEKKNNVKMKIEKEHQIANKCSILIPKLENLLAVYDSLEAPDKNALLSEVIESIDYIKTKKSPQNGPYNNFEIELHPLIPS